MPKVTITGGKGLVQSSGQGLEVKTSATFTGHTSFGGTGTISGLRSRQLVITKAMLGAGNRLELSASHSGQTLVLGDAGGGAEWYVQIPTGSLGWQARFALTGALTDDCVITGSAPNVAGTTGWQGNAVPMRGLILGNDDAAIATGILLVGAGDNAGEGVTFVTTTATSGSYVDVEVVKAGIPDDPGSDMGSPVVIVTGQATT